MLLRQIEKANEKEHRGYNDLRAFAFWVGCVMDDKQQEIIDEIRRVAKLLNVTSLTQREFSANSKISISAVESRYGNWTRAIEAAGLIPNIPRLVSGKPLLTDDDLLQEIMRLTSKLNKPPTEREMNAFGNYSVNPYRNRWGKFSDAVKVAYAKYGVPSGISVANPPHSKSVDNKIAVSTVKPAQTIPAKVYAPSKKTQYGEQMDFRGLRHAPLSEQGVVYMFGMVSRELGFLIEAVRIAYPDCLGKRLVNKNPQRWEDVRIEFEFKSSNFDHNPEECDLIVCWIHDWKDCPLEVLELRSAIGYLPNA